MASALEILCGQSYGAEQYQQVGTFTHAAILCLLLFCLPISILWIFTNELFVFMGQDPLISREAGKYTIWLTPSLFPFAILQSLFRYLQTQNLILPLLWSSLASLFIDVLLCWASVFKFNFFVSAGAALSISFSYWINVAMLGIYVKYSSACEKTYVPFSKDVLFCLKKFFQYAIPSTMMVWYFSVSSMYKFNCANVSLFLICAKSICFFTQFGVVVLWISYTFVRDIAKSSDWGERFINKVC